MKLLLCLLLLHSVSAVAVESLTWTPVANTQGVETVLIENGRLRILKIDPKLADVVLINASQTGQKDGIANTANRESLWLATNASMFDKDDLTSLGYMRNYDHINQEKFLGNRKGLLCFHPKKAGLPKVKIIYKEGNWKKEIKNYETVFESIRMIGRGANGKWESKWNPGASKFHHVALVGVDQDDQLLIFFHLEKIDMNDLNNIILSLPISLKGLLYLDGDFHGGLYLAPGTGLNSDPGFLIVPNILGVRAVTN